MLARVAHYTACGFAACGARQLGRLGGAASPAVGGLQSALRQAGSPHGPSPLVSLVLRCGVVAGPGVKAVQADVLRKARRMSPATGLLAGLFGSVVGVGGGVVIVPIIVSACRSIPQRLVSGTSLAAVLSTALVSASAYAQGGAVDPAAAAIVSPLALLTAPLGARLTSRLNCATLRRALGVFLICAAPLVPLKAYLLYKKEQQQGAGSTQGAPAPPTAPVALASPSAPVASLEPAPGSNEVAPPTWAGYLRAQRDAIAAMPPATVAVLAATGAVAGLASGLLGIGGGTIVTPLLALTMPYGQLTVLGTSLVAMVPPSAAALAQHARMGNVDWRMAAGLAAGTAAGGALGSAAALAAPPGVLEACFSIGMLFLGRKTLQTAR